MKKRTSRIGPFLPVAAISAVLCVCLIFTTLPAMADSPQEPAAIVGSASSAAVSEPARRPLKVRYSSAHSEADAQPSPQTAHSASAVLPEPAELQPPALSASEPAAAAPGESAAESSGVPDNLVLLDTFIATAYCVTGTTATGTYTTVGRTLAVNPNIIPYGTHVWLYLDDGTLVGDYYAEDTGSNMMANPYVVDIYMGEGSYNDCILWGAQHVSIYVEADAA